MDGRRPRAGDEVVVIRDRRFQHGRPLGRRAGTIYYEIVYPVDRSGIARLSLTPLTVQRGELPNSLVLAYFS